MLVCNMNLDGFSFGVDAKNISNFIDMKVADALRLYKERMRNQTTRTMNRY